jgi:hypothetical protein
VVGGLAVSARTEPRFTRDVDLVIAVSDDQSAEQTRIYYFNQTKPDDTQYEALAAGGWISCRSGSLLDTFAMGASLYGSAPLYAPAQLLSGSKGLCLTGYIAE